MTSREYILNTIRSHKSELAKLGISNIGLFGSYVRGDVSEDSDIDILIEFIAEKESFDNFMAAYDYFEEIFKNEKVDLVTKKSLSPYIGPAILNEVIYA
ncbi:MAG: nucleotidyltransferase family protein [Candidatus Heimdallarchaeota archaeon]|nr:nucleotidyltransferase family protein [Candidatus Heimdallarchaeota archaeon]